MTGMPIKIYENLDEKQCNAVGDEGEVNTHCQVAYPLEVINEEGRRNVNFECLRGDERRSYSRVLMRECLVFRVCNRADAIHFCVESFGVLLVWAVAVKNAWCR